MSDPEASYIGTEPWKPKEALQDDGVITDKADIFAFGLTLWEMMTLSVPHLNLDSDTDDEGLFPWPCCHVCWRAKRFWRLLALGDWFFRPVAAPPKCWVSPRCHIKVLQTFLPAPAGNLTVP